MRISLFFYSLIGKKKHAKELLIALQQPQEKQFLEVSTPSRTYFYKIMTNRWAILFCCQIFFLRWLAKNLATFTTLTRLIGWKMICSLIYFFTRRFSLSLLIGVWVVQPSMREPSWSPSWRSGFAIWEQFFWSKRKGKHHYYLETCAAWSAQESPKK